MYQLFCRDRELGPRFAQRGSFEYEFGMKWKELYRLEEEQKVELQRRIEDQHARLEMEMGAAQIEHQAKLLHQDYLRKQEELKRMEESHQQEMQRRLDMRYGRNKWNTGLTQWCELNFSVQFCKIIHWHILHCPVRSFRWMLLALVDFKSTLLAWVVVWSSQATSHYLSECWPSSVAPYGITMGQWVYWTVDHWNSTHGQHINWNSLQT